MGVELNLTRNSFGHHAVFFRVLVSFRFTKFYCPDVIGQARPPSVDYIWHIIIFIFQLYFQVDRGFRTRAVISDRTWIVL